MNHFKNIVLFSIASWMIPAGIAQEVILSTDSIPGTGLTFLMSKIPAGSFLMGSPEGEPGREVDEGPQQEVGIDGFWMGVKEVSFDEYVVFRERHLDRSNITSAGHSFDADAVTRPSPPYEDPSHGMGTEGYPASSMTQYAALEYCKWLYEKAGVFYRLPTEAEWEYACRAGTETTWFFGNDPAGLDDVAWYYGNSGGVFHPGGTKSPNPWGLYDMYGNVAEWTLDQYQEDFLAGLVQSGAENPWAEPTTKHPRTVRGGFYNGDPEDMRSAERFRSSMKWKERDPQIPKSYWWNTDSPFVGFRIVRPETQPSEEEIDAFWQLVLPD